MRMILPALGAGPTPRTRGAPLLPNVLMLPLRSNPANTGRSSLRAFDRIAEAVQPREHGALFAGLHWSRQPWGPTPRTRGARSTIYGAHTGGRSNPANTGRSSASALPANRSEVQPREHGALQVAQGQGRSGHGPTPRTRGAPDDPSVDVAAEGSNPANTGRSWVMVRAPGPSAVQPREHGALSSCSARICEAWGPTPRTRGAR